jgi:hypothetical protein
VASLAAARAMRRWPPAKHRGTAHDAGYIGEDDGIVELSLRHPPDWFCIYLAVVNGNGFDYHPVPDEPKPGTARAGWMIVWLAGAFLSFSSLEQWDSGWVIANACIMGSLIVVTSIYVAVQAVRNARIRLRHMRTFTALAFTGIIAARGRYSPSITHITVRCDGDGRSIPFIVPDNVGDTYTYLADSLLVGRRVIKRAGERWPSLAPSSRTGPLP